MQNDWKLFERGRSCKARLAMGIALTGIWLAGALTAAEPNLPSTKLIEVARKDLRANRAEKAFDALRAWVAKNPSDSHFMDALVLQGTCALRLKRDEIGVRILERVVTQANGLPPQADALEQLILHAEGKGNVARAKELVIRLETNFAEHPATIRGLVKRGEAAFAAGKYDEAIATFSRAGKKLPPEAASHLMIAQAMQNAASDPAKVLLAAESLLKADKRIWPLSSTRLF